MFRGNSYYRENEYSNQQPLGEVLVEAGLVSPRQIDQALEEQRGNSQFLIGEILALRGLLRQETANFFVEDWPKLIRRRSKKRIGDYFKQAALLNEAQIIEVVREHQRTGLRFGNVAVLQGFISEQTRDFFLVHLCPHELDESLLEGLYQVHPTAASLSTRLSSASRGRALRKKRRRLLVAPDEDSFFSNEFEPSYVETIGGIEDSNEDVFWVG